MLKFYGTAFARSTSIHWLLEEIGEPYEVELIDIRGKVPDDYRKVQAHKKVPAIVHKGITVTERAAITQYLCEAFPGKIWAPKPGDPLRAAFLSRLVYCDSVFDPALAAKALNFDYNPSDVSFGGFDDMLNYVESVLSQQDYVLTDQFSAIDTQWASGLHWGMNMLNAIPKKKIFVDYVERCTQREAFQKTVAQEEKWMAKLTKPAWDTKGAQGEASAPR